MKKFWVESRKDYTEYFDNYCGDYIEAESKEEAIELYKVWLIENGDDPEGVIEYYYRVVDYYI